MSRLGLTHGGFYAHFKSKDDLVRQAIEAGFDKTRTEFEQAAEGRGPAEALSAYVDYYLSMAHVDRGGGGCLLPRLAGDLSRLDDASREGFCGEGGAALGPHRQPSRTGRNAGLGRTGCRLVRRG